MRNGVQDDIRKRCENKVLRLNVMTLQSLIALLNIFVNYLLLLPKSSGGDSFLLFFGRVPPIFIGVASVILLIFCLT